MRILSVILLSLFAIACSNGIDKSDGIVTDLEGEWLWLFSTHSISDTIFTPETEDYTQKVAYKGNRFAKYRDDIPIVGCEFEIGIGLAANTGDTVDLIFYSDFTLPTNYYELLGDSLKLHDGGYEGLVHTYLNN